MRSISFAFAVTASLVLACDLGFTALAQTGDSDMGGPPRATTDMQQKDMRDTLMVMKSRVKHEWRPKMSPASEVLITNAKLSVNSLGKVDRFQIITPSKSPEEDQSIEQFITGFSFAPPPQDVDLYLTFSTNGKESIVEFAELPEAQKYYQQLCGGILELRDTYRPAVDPQMKHDDGLAAMLADLQVRLTRAIPEGVIGDRRMIIEFKIFRDGTLMDAHVLSSSGDAKIDDLALRAINSAPYSPVPTGDRKSIDMAIKFEHNKVTAR